MRIAFVTLQYPPHDAGGIGSYVQTVSAALVRAGHDVTVISAADDKVRSTTIEHPGVVVERFPMVGPRWLWAWWSRLEPERLRVHHALSGAWALRRIQSEFDVIEAPEWKAQGLLLRGTVVVHLHLPLEVRNAWDGGARRARHLSHLLERLGAERATAVTATSRLTSQMPDGRSWLQDKPVQIVAPPIDIGRWSGATNVESTEPRALFVGRLESRKAPEMLIDAIGHIRDHIPDATAVFVGRSLSHPSGLPYRDELEERAAQLGVRCEFHEPTSDAASMQRLYSSARVVVVPSRFEPLSLVAFEALAAGRPIVMSDRVGAAEWLGGLPGSVVPADDVAALASAIRPHLLDSRHAAEVGRQGRRLVSEICSDQNLVETRVAVYESVLAATRRRKDRHR